MDTSTTTSNAAGLREAADLLDAYPDLPQPSSVTGYSTGSVYVFWFLHHEMADRAEQKSAATAIVRAIGGKWDKAEFGDDFSFKRRLGLLDLTVQVERPAVCERVVVGTETVTIPAKPAEPERTETHEKVEWRCQPLLADEPRDVTAPSVAPAVTR